MAKVPGTEKPGPRGGGLGAAVGAGQGGTVCVGEALQARGESGPWEMGGVWEGGGGGRGLNGWGQQGGGLLGFVQEQGGSPGQAAPHGAGGVGAAHRASSRSCLWYSSARAYSFR